MNEHRPTIIQKRTWKLSATASDLWKKKGRVTLEIKKEARRQAQEGQAIHILDCAGKEIHVEHPVFLETRLVLELKR